MIKIKATSEGKRTKLDMNVQGRGVEIIDEAAHILTHLPKSSDRGGPESREAADPGDNGRNGVHYG